MLQSKVRRITTAMGLATALALAPAIPAQAAGKRAGKVGGLAAVRATTKVAEVSLLERAWEWMVGALEVFQVPPSGPTAVWDEAGGGIDPNGGTNGGSSGSTSTSTTCTTCKGTTVP